MLWLPLSYLYGYLKSYLCHYLSDLHVCVRVTWLPLYVGVHTRVRAPTGRGLSIFSNGVTTESIMMC